MLPRVSAEFRADGLTVSQLNGLFVQRAVLDEVSDCAHAQAMFFCKALQLGTAEGAVRLGEVPLGLVSFELVWGDLFEGVLEGGKQ